MNNSLKSMTEESTSYFHVVDPNSKTQVYSEETLSTLQHSDRDAILKKAKYNILLNPFELQEVFGFNTQTKVLNFTKSSHIELFFVSSHVGVFYYHTTKEMVFLQGHRNAITCAGTDRGKKWLVTTDRGDDSLMLVWDIQERKIIFSIFQPYPNGVFFVHMTLNAKYLISTGLVDDKWRIDFWLWTFGDDKPNGTVLIPNIYGMPKVITSHPNANNLFMVVFEKVVVFLTWDEKTHQLSEPYIPPVRNRKAYGNFVDGTYVLFCHETMVACSKGNVLIFGFSLYAKHFKLSGVSNYKFFVKAIKISKCSLTCMKSSDGMLVIGDANGCLLCFDKKMRLLYWYNNVSTQPITSISFSMDSQYRFRNYDYNLDDSSDSGTQSKDEDRSDTYFELIRTESIPRDISLERNPFTMRQIIISTLDGRIVSVDTVGKEILEIFNFADSFIVAIEVHDQFPYLLTACKSRKITMFNYETHEEVVTVYLPEFPDDPIATISCIKYSTDCLHLACGLTNGGLWVLEPILLSPKIETPLKYCNDNIEKIVFSPDSLQLAYYDFNMTVILHRYDVTNEEWIFKGKVRAHYESIVNILFSPEPPYYLFTLGRDRHLVQYNNFGEPDGIALEILTRDRVEQKDIPVYFITCPKQKPFTYEYLLVDNRHKYKKLNDVTKMCMSVYLGPAFGCFHNSPVRKMEILPNTDNQYIIFMNNKFIGLQMLPIDGNPYKFVSTLAHPRELVDFAMSADGQYVFTFGSQGHSVLKWKVNLKSVATMHQLGGLELEPFYCLIEGGKNGWLFQEIQDLFYYMQILHQGENNPLPRVVTDSIDVNELPDMMRACGYYPSDYEIENMLVDITYRVYDETETLRKDITFCEFVQLYINHKPVYGYTIDELRSNFNKFTEFSENLFREPGTISSTDFLELFTTTGESFNKNNLQRCLNILLHQEHTMKDTSPVKFMPKDINFEIFTEDMLGIEIKKDANKRLEREKSEIVKSSVYKSVDDVATADDVTADDVTEDDLATDDVTADDVTTDDVSADKTAPDDEIRDEVTFGKVTVDVVDVDNDNEKLVDDDKHK